MKKQRSQPGNFVLPCRVERSCLAALKDVDDSMLTLKDFDYELPRELVAPYPVPKRSEARLLVLDRKSARMEHRIFKELPEYLRAGDLLVLNNTKVLPARLFGKKPTGGKVEALLLKPIERNLWEVLIKPSGRVKGGTKITFGENGVTLEGEVLDEPSGETGVRQIRFNLPQPSGLSSPLILRPANSIGGTKNDVVLSVLNQIGHIPLPPYIDRPDEAIDRELYQTVFAEIEGAVASPTAGLHFDKELLRTLRERGIEVCFVTLHVSYGTFQPVQSEDLSQHEMYEEEFEVKAEAAKQIKRAKKEGRRIVACGTTAVRVLETMVETGGVTGGATLASLALAVTPPQKTRLFIYPPYKFKIVDAMITNFHLPRTTLFMLVSAFAGRTLVFKAYEEAIRERYRFYSYGDAMLIL